MKTKFKPHGWKKPAKKPVLKYNLVPVLNVVLRYNLKSFQNVHKKNVKNSV